jgi:hypothetical protein
MSGYQGFTVAASQIGGGLAESALPNAPVVADEPPSWDETRHMARQLVSAALQQLAVASAWLARRIEPSSQGT